MPVPRSHRRRALRATLAAALLTLALPGAASALEYVPDEVVVRYKGGTDAGERTAVQRKSGVGSAEPTGTPNSRVLTIRDGASVPATIAELRRDPRVASALPNLIARTAFVPRDPGNRTGGFGGWRSLQWNFLPFAGVNATAAWDNLRAAGAPGARGQVVAVIDTGVAYRNAGRLRRSPDFLERQFVSGYDFVQDDSVPVDTNGHGTHVAGTIAERTDNSGFGVTGLAYNARLMPVRVLDANGEGSMSDVARGIRYAVKRGARLINMSLEFGTGVQAFQIPDVMSALRYAARKRAFVAAAAGNEGDTLIAYPARAPGVVAVGGTTARLCRADYSNQGRGLDIMAPGGGQDAFDASATNPFCRPSDDLGPSIRQMTFEGSGRRFELADGWNGTSMATAHVTATAALVRAAQVIGRNPTPGALERRLAQTARVLGPKSEYGAGLLDAARATAR